MKANKKFVEAEEAVSPVIAVILMVAITVVLAATVFVLVSDIGGNTGSSAPAISWAPDESQDRLAVTTAAQNADWFRLTMEVAGGTCGGVINGGQTAGYIATNQAALTGGVDASGAASNPCVGPATVPRVGNAADKISAGDYVAFCSETAESTNVKIVVKDTTANSIVLTHTFTNVAVCTA